MKRKRTHYKIPLNEIKESRKYVSWQCFYSTINETLSCPCAYNKGIWQRGGIPPCTTNPALMHTVPLDNIVATIISTRLLAFLLHKIELATTWNRWLTNYVSWHPYFYGLLIFSITYPHSLALRGTLAQHECVVWLTLYLIYKLEAGWFRFGLEAL
jgi:hypothetical protein